jgi:hypothetical protein
MNTRRRFAVLVLIGAAFATAQCQGTPTGPSLANMVVADLQWQPTIDNSPTLCCCHLLGRATNNNSVAVHATLTVTTYKQSEKLLSVVYMMKDVPPGATRQIDAAGFMVPCNEITGWNYELSVKGITYPPF